MKARVAATNAELGKRRGDVASYAVNAYVMGDQGGSASDVLASTDGNEVGRREGYTSAAIGNRQDLLDRLHTAKAEADVQTTALHQAEQVAAAAKAKVDAKRKAAQSAVDEQQQIVSTVKGQLARGWSPRSSVARPPPRPPGLAPRPRHAATQVTSHPAVDEPPAPPVRLPVLHAGRGSTRRRRRGRGHRRGPERARCPVHVGRCVAEHRVRLLGSRDVGVGPRRPFAPALVGRAVQLHAAHLDE